MYMRFGFFFYLVLNFAGLLIASRLFDGIIMTGFGWAALAALVLTLLHIVVRPIFILFTLPLTVMTMGLFLLIINGLMFWLAGSVLDGYQVHGFGSAIGGAIVVSLLGMIAGWLAGGTSAKRPDSGQKMQFYTFRPGAGQNRGGGFSQNAGQGRTAQNLRPPQNQADENVVDLEVDESGQWKIKD